MTANVRPVFVKICGITTEEDALLAVALGADALGFVFAPSGRQIAVDRVREIVGRLPRHILTVGVFRDELPDRVVDIVNSARLGAAQLHGQESAEQTNSVRDRVPMVIKAFPAGHPGLSDIASYHADAVLVDSATPGSGKVFDWRLAEDAPHTLRRVILAGGLTPLNVAAAIRRVKPWGVDVSTGVELTPGIKDAVKIREFIETVKTIQADDSASNGSPGADDNDSTGPYNWEEDFTQ